MSPRPGSGPRSRPALAPDLWLLGVSLAAGLGVARLTQAPGAAHVVGPITVTVVAGHLGTSIARRLRLSVTTALIAGAVAVVLATVWGELLSATRGGIPTLTTWRSLVSKLDTAGAVIRSHPTPVPATPEIVLCIAMGAGLVAVFSRALWARQEARGTGPMVTLVPTFGLFCYTALLSSQVDRVTGVVTYLVCALAFVITADRTTVAGTVSLSRATASASAYPEPARRTVTSGLLSTLPAVVGAVLAVLVPLAASPALSTLKVDALPFPQPDGGARGLSLATGDGTGGGGPAGVGNDGDGLSGVRAIDLVDNLQAVLVNRTTDVMFDARTSLPTYWQVAVLTDFDGTTWVPDPTTEAAAQSFALSPQSQGVPGLPVLPEPPVTRTFRAKITIGDLESTLLPVPPTTFSLNTFADLVPGFGAVQPVEAVPGLNYTAVARVPVAPTTNATSKARSTTPDPDTTGTETSTAVSASDLAPYLALPVEPAPVVALAHQIVAGAKGPAAEAADLARWFDGGRYRYTLTPPASAGPDALESFLFTTRAGFCQQFAAAYGVLARLDGLPTRIAVGFTTGDSQGHDRYQVTGADAHVWPEVYLGPSTGWTSYEPTPASSGEATGVGVNSGSKSSAQNPRGRSTATTASTIASIRHHFSSNAPVPTTLPALLRSKAAATPVTPDTSSGSATGAVGIVAALAVLVLLGAWWARRAMHRGWDPVGLWRARRRRRRRRPAPDPTAAVLDQWHDAAAVLERARLGRQPAETLQEHAIRLRSLAGARWLVPYQPIVSPGTPPHDIATRGTVPAASAHLAMEATIEAYAALAALAARASYGSDPCTPEEAADAERLGALVASGLAQAGARRRPVASS
jgi:hypothetical protein